MTLLPETGRPGHQAQERTDNNRMEFSDKFN
ncbi:hypothetical protein CJA_1647 [Cellvibrio japonicus Ueda107]|uniref:Uncharacterized protein n=1 Tax=Cellvibrio japonicus (strain Ueda107) TaxID=498211 RepID=B3PES3_CELJU|nr:hypothetical protein CJA_1647 [Cellvibrio japonicus Ueda107]